MAEMDNRMKLLFSAFIIIILGVVLIQPIADDVEQVSTYSIVITNETLTLSNVLGTISNETLILTSSITGTLANFNISSITEIRNGSSDIMTGDCNITFGTGAVVCNATSTDTTNVTYWDYIHVSGKIATLANTDEILSLDALRNVSSEDIRVFCNFTINTGGLACNNTLSFTAYADYQYDTDQYVRSGASRTLLTITVLFFALAILAVGVGYAVKSFKEGKIM